MTSLTRRASHAAETANTDATSNEPSIADASELAHLAAVRQTATMLLNLALSALCYTPITTLPALSPTRTAAIQMATLPADEKVAFLLLAGGSGSRMKADRPKQFLELRGKPVLQYTLELLLGMASTAHLVLVIADEYRDMDFLQPSVADGRLIFADPGAERQDSVRSGLAAVPADCTLVAVHDAARPLVTPEVITNCLCDAAEHGAAVLAVPMKPTVKESADGQFVARTLDRSKLWDVQTPQVIRPEILKAGFDKVEAENLEVTDDVSIVVSI